MLKKLFAMLFVLMVVKSVNAQTTYSGDTIFVQAFTYNTSLDSTILFPSDTIRFEKILMRYRLRCPYTVQCGEWDYQTYTYAYRPTGAIDSVQHVVPSYVINGTSPASLNVISSPTYTYQTPFDYFVNYTSVVSYDSALIGAGNTVSSHPFQASLASSRSQYIWKASDLAAAGLTAGNISGIKMNVTSLGNSLNNVVIRLKHTALDSITNTSFETSGLTEVYHHAATINTTGWHGFNFVNPFTWDGLSNLVVDISFTNAQGDSDFEVAADDLMEPVGITSANEDRALFFYNKDYIDVPVNAFAALDSVVTISFWQYGNPDIQPQDNSLLEATDSLGNRVLNVHLPWGNGSVYFDAGNTGNVYDRINKAAADSLFEGKWNHWTFVKNAGQSRMRMYVNGTQWHWIPNRVKLMSGISKFRIGSGINATNNYDGYLDDVQIFRGELSAATIAQWQYLETDASHPDYSKLLYYFKMNDADIKNMHDEYGSNNGIKNGYPKPVLFKGHERFKNFISTSYRPQIIFEQGVYTSVLDSSLVVDSILNDPDQILIYGDSLNPLTVTDTLLTFPQAYSYVFDNAGNAIDSSLAVVDSVLTLQNYVYYDPPYAVTERFELGRFITPYGNGLNLGNGFTWWYDVSDYRNILHDSLRIVSGNWQELQDLQFIFIKGIPPRDPLSITNLWNGKFYQRASDSIEVKRLYPKMLFIDSTSINSRVKLRTTGHGADNQNCAEFCVQVHKLKVDGVQQWNGAIWKDDCAINPLYPQGGTWVYQRANWCPGDVVPTVDVEISQFTTPGDSVELDYDASNYTSVGGSPANWDMASQLIEYSAPNFSHDATVLEIMRPSNYDIYKRMNPICNNPVIVIRNNGSSVLNSLTIEYGIVGGTPSTYSWSGNLALLQTEMVELGSINWNVPPGLFYARVYSPNGVQDQYTKNDTMYSWFSTPPQYPQQLVFEFKTNNEAYQNSYTIKDDQGNLIWSRSGLTNNTTYADTLNLTTGCYKFKLNDTGEDGLSWWANPGGGAGFMRIRNAATGTVIKTFNADCGKEMYQEFTVGYLLPTIEFDNESHILIYPNPAEDFTVIDISLSTPASLEIAVYDATGKLMHRYSKAETASEKINLDTRAYAAGLYFVRVKAGDEMITRRFAVQK